MLARWIARGRPEVDIEPDVADDRSPIRWSPTRIAISGRFNRRTPVAAPAVKQRRHVRNPIDAFVLQKLEQRG